MKNRITGKLFPVTGLAALVITGMMTTPTVAADKSSGFYGKVHGGLVIPEDSDSRFTTIPLNARSEGKVGYRFGGALGYRLSMGLRGEAEVAYQKVNADRVTFTSSVPQLNNSGDANGSTSALSVMGNLLYDVPVEFFVTPYFGGGVGIAWVHANDIAIPSVTTAVTDDSDSTVAYQALAGVQRKVGGVLVGLQYRYFRTGDFNLTGNDGERSVTDHVSSHNIEVQVTVPFSVFE